MIHSRHAVTGMLALIVIPTGPLLIDPASPRTIPDFDPAVGAKMYPVDTAHSALEFVVRFMGLSKVRGRFADFGGTIMYDTERPENSTVTLIADVASIDTDNDFRDRHLRSPDWFDAETHPLITFQSRKIDRQSEDRFIVHGPLTIHGVTREVAIPVTRLHQEREDAWGNRRIGFEGELEINRKDFGVEGTNFFNRAFDVARMGVADEIRIEFTISGRILNMERIDFGAAEGKTSLGEHLLEVIDARGITEAVREYHTLRQDRSEAFDFREGQLNTLGYKLLQQDRAEQAIEVFKLNLAAHPESANAYDSLAEAYATIGSREAAIENYEKALARDRGLTSAIEMLRWLEGQTSVITLAGS